MELSGEIPVKILCKAMGIQRSSFYAWKKHLSHPSEREKNLASNVRLFQEYHSKYPSHGYRLSGRRQPVPDRTLGPARQRMAHQSSRP